jgi:ElaB/YqjD/DUF883 family membrane-anchored ribosome-binding protein
MRGAAFRRHVHRQEVAMGATTEVSEEARRMKNQAMSSGERVGETAAQEGRKLRDQAGESADRLADTASDELARLRAQVERLMSERVTPALAGAADQVQEYAEHARDAVEHQADLLSDTVRERPLLAVSVATLGGYLLGRLIGGNTYVYPRGH